jgi:hypothetical protein
MIMGANKRIQRIMKREIKDKELQEEGLEISHLIFKENNNNLHLFHKECCQNFQEME